jgi:hypothetical protein
VCAFGLSPAATAGSNLFSRACQVTVHYRTSSNKAFQGYQCARATYSKRHELMKCRALTALPCNCRATAVQLPCNCCATAVQLLCNSCIAVHSLHSAAPDVCTRGLSPQQLPGVTSPAGHTKQLLNPPGLNVLLRQGWQYAAPGRTPSPARQTAHDTHEVSDRGWMRVSGYCNGQHDSEADQSRKMRSPDRQETATAYL